MADAQAISLRNPGSQPAGQPIGDPRGLPLLGPATPPGQTPELRRRRAALGDDQFRVFGVGGPGEAAGL